jgi:uncharacterized protein YbjT (DUF2867 family)
MRAPTLVTGATGTIGRHVVAGLHAEGLPVRAAATDPARVNRVLGDVLADTVEPVRLDFTDPVTWADAYADAEVVFLVRPPQLANIARDMVPSLEAARRCGVRHVVLLSLQGAESNRVVPHATIEAWLRRSGLHWTFVRPSFFAENLTTTHVTDIRDRDEIVVPAGAGATAFVTAADVAAVVTAALLDPTVHRGRAWTPTGPESLTYAEVAAILSDVLDRPIRYRRPGAGRYATHARRTLGMPWGMVAVTTAIYTVARLGKAGGLTDDVRVATGRDPIAFRDWAEEHRDAWLRPMQTAGSPDPP